MENNNDKFWMAITDEEGFLEARYYKGMEKGLERGLERGPEKGRAEGLAAGKDEANRENARKMKSLGMPTEVIAQVTGHISQQANKAFFFYTSTKFVLIS